ncbi:MAG: glycosyltransferase [Actinomycetota bacterium]|nr:glycosyltransferase [Actinomycetota bacterium]
MSDRSPGALAVALAHPFLWPEVRRGAERYLEDLARFLAGRGHQVTVVTGTWDAPSTVRRSDGVVVRRFRHRRAGPIARFGIGEVETFGQAAFSALWRQRFDLVHAFTPTAALAARAAGLRTIYSVLGHPVRAQLPADRLPRWLFAAAARHATVTAALSEASADALRSWSGLSARVLAPGVHMSGFEPALGARAGPPRLLFSASLADPRKRADLAIAALAGVLPRHPHARLRLSGAGDAKPILAAAAVFGDKVAQAVDVLGPGEPDEVPERYRQATVTVLPADHEAFGLALVESLACGTPVVCSPSGGMPEIVVPEVGRVAASASAADLSVAVLEAVDLAAEPGTAARCVARARHWDWDTSVGPAHEALYREVAASRGAWRRRLPASAWLSAPVASEKGSVPEGQRAEPSRPDRGSEPGGARLSAVPRSARREAVLHFAADWLPPSEVFVHDLVRSLRRPGVVVAADPVHDTERFPVPELHSLARYQRYVRPLALRPPLEAVYLEILARRRQVSVVHAHHGYRSDQAARLARRLGIAMVLSLHGHDVTGYLEERPDAYRLVVPAADAVVVPSRFLAALAVEAGFRAEQVRVIPSGVDTTVFRPTPLPAGDPVVLFVGRFVAKKGIDVLARAWPLVQRAVPAARLRLLGFGPLEAQARAIAGRVSVERAPDRRQVAAAMREARVVVSPSHRAADDSVESLLMVNLEAQASARPVVTTAHGGICEYVRHMETAVVVRESDATSLAEALVRLCLDDDLARRLGHLGPRWAAQFDLRATAARIDALYDELVDARRST